MEVRALSLPRLAGAPGAADGIDWPDEDLPSAVARLEEMLIRRALERSAGNRTDAAKELNINRQLLYAKMQRYGFTKPEGRELAARTDCDESRDPDGS